MTVPRLRSGALDAAADLAGYGSIVTVIDVGARNGRALEAARLRLIGRQVPALYVEGAGEPAEELLAKARELDADLVVVGRGSEAVVRELPCNVLLVR